MMWLALLLTCERAPVIEWPATGTSDRFAIMVTGDGGWRRVDAKVTDKLRANGIPIVGFIASTYFQTRRSPDESACALAQLIQTYQQRWHKRRVILIGYSRGADVLPFMINRLPPDIRSSIQLTVLLGLEPWIDFEYHPIWTWAHYTRHAPQYSVLPEAERLRGEKVLCVYGEREKDSLCDKLAGFKTLRLPGGHHFAGHYDAVADAILNALR